MISSENAGSTVAESLFNRQQQHLHQQQHLEQMEAMRVQQQRQQQQQALFNGNSYSRPGQLPNQPTPPLQQQPGNLPTINNNLLHIVLRKGHFA